MTEILFYHLEHSSLETVLPGLLEKTLKRKWKAVVKAASPAQVEALDEHLWTYTDQSFLPHGAGGDGTEQPIWLSEQDDCPNAADILFLVGGAAAEIGQLDQFTRCVTIFDGRNDDAVSAARQFWKSAKECGHETTYWKQSSEGRWEKQG